LTPMQALKKLEHYCAYQERCHSEVRSKLYDYGLNTTDVDKVTAHLIAENFLNEERFAIAFAGGKFRVKDWGKVKIKYELKGRQVSDYCIRKALAQIDLDDYENKLNKLAEKKWESTKATNVWDKMAKTTTYLMQKGYESDLVRVVVNELKKK
jgi:regulatory protein